MARIPALGPEAPTRQCGIVWNCVGEYRTEQKSIEHSGTVWNSREDWTRAVAEALVLLLALPWDPGNLLTP